MGMEGFFNRNQLDHHIDALILHCKANSSSTANQLIHQMIELSNKLSQIDDTRSAANLI